MSTNIKIAIIDLYDGYPNEGMRCIKTLIEEFFDEQKLTGNYDVFDLRGTGASPNLKDYQIFIATGGPGSPIITGEAWETKYFDLLNSILEHNQSNHDKKFLFMICHSFQLMVQHYNFGLVCRRKSTSFGIMPVHKTNSGENEPLFDNLENPFWAVDSRDYQVIQPNLETIETFGASIIALEKVRPHIPLERAIMGIRLSPQIIGLQFHPEADAEGMRRYFQQADKKMAVITEHGEDKFEEMIFHLEDPDKISLTESEIIPKFLSNAVKDILTLETA